MATFGTKTLSTATLEAISAASQVVGRPIVRAGSSDFHYPDDTVVVALSFETLAAKSVRIVRSSAAADEVLTIESGANVYVTAGLRLVDIARIYLTADNAEPVAGSVTLDLSYLGRRFMSPAMLVEWPGGKGERQILELQSDREDRRKELIAHLNANRVYYSNAIHRSLDSGTILAMLAEYSWNGRPLIDQVEPQPLTMAGNYLVFRAPAEPVDASGVSENGKQKNWGELLEDRAIKVGRQSADERLIPLPTAGVFAEAVLGRSNAAEKLDITRFWNWQDSPIPLAPTEIAPVGTGTRATAEDLRPGQLGQPVLNIVNPQTLPNPAGLGAVLGTLASPNMFRDMSGLAGTQGLVQAGMQETMQGATDAGQLASANMRTEAQKAVAMGQIAADIVKSVMGGGAGGGSAVQGISGSGAMINHGKSMDKVAASNPTSGGGRNSGGADSSGALGPNQQEAFDRALHGELGASGANAATAVQAMGLTQVSGPGELPVGGAGSSGNTSHIPVDEFIKNVQAVENAYPSDNLAQTLTRIRQHYYPLSSTSFWTKQKDGIAFDQLIPDSPQSEGVGGQRRLMREGIVNKLVLDRLTAKGDENGVSDNPSPYLLVENRLVDLGHAFLGFDALLHPIAGSPYSTYGIPNIDPASWVADLALAAYWTVTYERNGKPDAPDVIVDAVNELRAQGQLGRPLDFDDFYKMSAPESDLLGDADAFGLFQQATGQSKLSKVLSGYYWGNSPGFKRRWRTFCAGPNDLKYGINQDAGGVVWLDGYMQKWVPRIERLCDLFEDGAWSLVNPSPARRPWKYAQTAARKFQDWVKGELEKEINAGPPATVAGSGWT